MGFITRRSYLDGAQWDKSFNLSNFFKTLSLDSVELGSGREAAAAEGGHHTQGSLTQSQ